MLDNLAVAHTHDVDGFKVDSSTGGRHAQECPLVPPLYPQWQEYFRKYQPPMLIVWGRNDQIFPAAGAEPYKRDLKTVEFHLLDAGHFALESDGDLIAGLMRDFLDRHVAARDPSPNEEV
jgi:pimeloyl-ACP methyl ester carboxylesterase